jgi:hypothetical protein
VILLFCALTFLLIFWKNYLQKKIKMGGFWFWDPMVPNWHRVGCFGKNSGVFSLIHCFFFSHQNSNLERILKLHNREIHKRLDCKLTAAQFHEITERWQRDRHHASHSHFKHYSSPIHQSCFQLDFETEVKRLVRNLVLWFTEYWKIMQKVNC